MPQKYGYVKRVTKEGDAIGITLWLSPSYGEDMWKKKSKNENGV